LISLFLVLLGIGEAFSISQGGVTAVVLVNAFLPYGSGLDNLSFTGLQATLAMVMSGLATASV